MAKLTLTDLVGGYLSTTAINANYALMETALLNTLSRDGSGPNTMSAQLDMNSQRIVNLVDAVNNQEPVTLAQANLLAGVTNALTQNTVGEVLWPDTAEETAAGVTTTKNYYENPDPRRYGAVDDTDRTASGTDNTAAFAAAVSVNSEEIPVKFRGQVGDLTIKNNLNGYGYGEIFSLAGAATVFNLVKDDRGWGDWANFQFKDLKINCLGDALPRTIHGFQYPLADPSTTDKTLAGRNMFINVIIGWADIAIYQPTGNFGNILIGCHLTNGNYGIWGQDQPTPTIMHPGMLEIIGGEISGMRKAGIYLSCDTENINGIILTNVSIEGNVGHGLYLDGMNLCPDGPLLHAVHFENNDRDDDGTIDLGFGKGSETIRDLMCHDVDMIRIISTHCTDVGFEFNNSMALMDTCFFNGSSRLQQDADSVVVCTNANLDGLTYLADVEITSLVQQRRTSGSVGATMVARIPERTHIVKKLAGTGVGVFGQSYSHDSITLNGSGGTGVRTAGPNGLYPYYNKYTSLNVSTGYSGILIALVQNKWYMYSMMIRKSAFDLDLVKYQNGTVHLVQAFENILDNNVDDNVWVTVGGVTEFSGTSGNCRQLITTDGGSVPDISLGPAQVVQFDTQHEAIEYFNSGGFFDADNLEYNGTALLSGGTLAIDFTDEGFQDQPDTDYNIQLTPDTSTLAYVSAKSATGFTITGSSTANVSWNVTRKDL